MFGDRFSSSRTCSRWRHETEPGRLDQSLSCRFLKVATHPLRGIAGHFHVETPGQPGHVAQVATDGGRVAVDPTHNLAAGPRGDLPHDGGPDGPEAEVHDANAAG